LAESSGSATRSILVFIGLLWVILFVDLALRYGAEYNLNQLGLRPRSFTGLVGIVTMPFLHGGWHHLMSNTIPLCVLLFLLVGSRDKIGGILVGIVLLSGLLLWMFGRGYTHVGASGLVYGLAAFLIVAGFRERRFVPLIVAVLTLFMYGGSLFFGLLPTAGPQISWDGHLTGAIAGGLVALAGVKKTVS